MGLGLGLGSGSGLGLGLGLGLCCGRRLALRLPKRGAALLLTAAQLVELKPQRRLVKVGVGVGVRVRVKAAAPPGTGLSERSACV